jgi:hypothetical protein
MHRVEDKSCVYFYTIWELNPATSEDVTRKPPFFEGKLFLIFLSLLPILTHYSLLLSLYSSPSQVGQTNRQNQTDKDKHTEKQAYLY